MKKFLSIKESPYHGLNFCQGTVSEDLQDPGKEIYDVIRYFGSPRAPDPRRSQQLTTFAFCFGYIQALIQAVDRLPV